MIRLELAGWNESSDVDGRLPSVHDDRRLALHPRLGQCGHGRHAQRVADCVRRWSHRVFQVTLSHTTVVVITRKERVIVF